MSRLRPRESDSGVRSAPFIDTLPLALDHSSNTIYIEGQPVTDQSKLPLAIPYFASPKYFETMSIALRDKAMGFLPSGHVVETEKSALAFQPGAALSGRLFER